jgi:bifunctional UDP-N-acetylglucosamine pyrophosphorylase/glucosamine-1-phosphate N-acetyltransferase
MRSETPKMLFPLCGRPLLRYAMDAVLPLDPEIVAVVAGADVEALRAALPDVPLRFVVQDPPRGTGDALLCARDAVAGPATLLVLPGDLPLLTPALLGDAVAAHRDAGHDLTVLSMCPEEPGRYGRLLRGPDGRLQRIVEAADATVEQLTLREANTGVYVLRNTAALWDALARLSADNAQGELYITDLIGIYRSEGRTVNVIPVSPPTVAMGVNTRADLAEATRWIHRRTARTLMESGVTLLDPDRCYIEPGVRIGPDTVVLPDTHLRGGTSVGRGCSLGPGTWIEDARIGDRTTVRYSVVESAAVAEECAIGPYAHLRPGTEIGRGCRIGNFVEVKASQLGDGVKAGHLAYIGDAHIGEAANIGAGAITCNYDGATKHRTIIGREAFIGSNAALVAPVTIGDGAVIAAGSTITEDVPAGQVAFGRARQTNRRKEAERPGRSNA